MIPITRLNHAVLFVRDLPVVVAFYRRAFGFEVISEMAGKAAFLRARNSANHHDLGLFATPSQTRSPSGSPGLYHLAWEVPTIEDLAAARTTLSELGALVGESDHGAVGRKVWESLDAYSRSEVMRFAAVAPDIPRSSVIPGCGKRLPRASTGAPGVPAAPTTSSSHLARRAGSIARCSA